MSTAESARFHTAIPPIYNSWNIIKQLVREHLPHKSPQKPSPLPITGMVTALLSEILTEAKTIPINGTREVEIHTKSGSIIVDPAHRVFLAPSEAYRNDSSRKNSK